MNTEDTEKESALHRFVNACDGDVEVLGDRISGVLEFLTVRAALDAPFVIYADNKESIVVVAVGDDVKPIADALPDNFKQWEDDLDTVEMPEGPDYLTDTDPGDEQDEPTSEQE